MTTLLRTVLFLLVCLFAALPARSEEPLTFVTWGGAYTRSQMLAFVRPFEEGTGGRVNVVDYNGGLDEIREQVNTLNVKWDVVDLEPADAIRGCRDGLFIKIKPDQLAPGLFLTALEAVEPVANGRPLPDALAGRLRQIGRAHV